MRKQLGAAIALVCVIVLPAPAAGQIDGPQLTLIGEQPIEAQFDDGVADLGVTIRNDSPTSAPLTPRLVLDTGTEVPVGSEGVEVDETRLTLTAIPSSFEIRPRDVGRLRLELNADPVPTEGVTGVLVVDAPGDDVASLAVRLTAAAAELPSRFAKAKVEPAKITIVVRRWWPSFSHGSGGSRDDDLDDGVARVSVEGLETATAPTEAHERDVAVASSTGGRGRLGVRIPVVARRATGTTLFVDPEVINQRGTYEATIPLDATAASSPALTVTVIAGDHWMWPLIVLLLGAGLAYWLVEVREMVRPRRVLQLALTRAQARHAANVAAVDGRGLAKPYTLGAMFPSGAWDCALRPSTEAVDLFCRIDRAPTQEELDVIAEQVADLEKRIDMWPSVCAKAEALKKAKDQLVGRPHATNMMSASEELIEKAAVPADEAAAKAYMKSLDEQVEAVREWLIADALLEEALGLFARLDDPPRRHDPARWLPDLEAAKSLTDLKRCRVVPGFCRDVHVLRTLVVKRKPDARSWILGTRAAGAEDAVPAPQPVFVEAAPPPLEGPALTRYLSAVIVAGDAWALLLTTGVVALAYIAAIYSDTYGSVLQYITAFAAGAGGTFAASWKLLPWYTTFKRPKPSA